MSDGALPVSYSRTYAAIRHRDGIPGYPMERKHLTATVCDRCEIGSGANLVFPTAITSLGLVRRQPEGFSFCDPELLQSGGRDFSKHLHLQSHSVSCRFFKPQESSECETICSAADTMRTDA